MSDQIKQIAERLQGLRDVLELTLMKWLKVASFQWKSIWVWKAGERYFCQCFTENSP